MPLTPAEREDLIRRYAEGPAKVRAAWERVPEAARHWRPGEGKWSAHEIVCHCGDAEANAAMRIRYLAAEKEPLIIGYDQEAWARVLDYAGHPAEPALALMDAARASTVALLRRVPDSLWTKRGRHTESGEYSAEDWLQIYAEHLEKHADQIDRGRAAWEASQGR